MQSVLKSALKAIRVLCIGTRSLTAGQRVYLEGIGSLYAEAGYTVVTGNAPGADQSFALGASIIRSDAVELYLPWAGFEQRAIAEGNRVLVCSIDVAAWQLAQRSHLAWGHLSMPAKKLLARNASMVLSRPDFCVAYPGRSKEGWGGTGHCLRCCVEVGVPAFLLDAGVWHNGGR